MHFIRFLWTPWGLIGGLLLVAVTAVLSFLAWRQSGYSRATGLLEALRLAIVTLIAITLNQPEWLEPFQPEERPTLVVLADESASMNTLDVFDSTRPAKPPVSRQEWLKPLLQPESWSALSDQMEVVFESFSSSMTEPAEGTDLHAALVELAEAHDNLRGVVLLSDGDWNVGQPPVRAAARLRTKHVPVFAVAVGSSSRLPDLELLRVDAPTFGVVNKPIRIPFVIDSALPRDLMVDVTLQPTAGAEVTKQVTIPAMSRLNDSMVWKPTEKGDHDLRISLPVQDAELVESNNELIVPIRIQDETLKVLLVESVPRWEYRYLRNALERDPGVDVSCLLFHAGVSKLGGGRGYLKAFPETVDELSQFDVIFLGDVGVGDGQLSLEACHQIKGMVQSQASGLILMPGLRGGHLSLLGTDLEELYPVVLDAAQRRGWGSRVPDQFELTEAGRRSLLTKLEDTESDNARLWESLPGFQWYAPVLRAKAGAEVLAIHRTASSRFGRLPLLVTKTYGTGKILFMGTDAAWRWREGVEDKYHYRFWGQVARWMAYQRGMAQGELMRLFYFPDRPQQDELLTLNANVMSSGGEPLQSGTVMVQVESPSGKLDSVRMTPHDEWGLFTGSLSPREHGVHRMTLLCRENGSKLETTVTVQQVSREKLGQPVRQDVLEEITTMTGGKLASTGDVRGLLGDIAALPEPEPQIRRLRLWCHPAWAGVLVVLLGALWTGRKMMGAV